MPKFIEGMIVSDSDNGIQCCHRDNDYDGNCAIHSAPGVLRDEVQRINNYVRDFDWSPRGTQTGRFSSRSTALQDTPRVLGELHHRLASIELWRRESRFASYEGHNDLEARVTKVEERQSLLFQAVEKIINLLKPIRSWLRYKSNQIR